MKFACSYIIFLIPDFSLLQRCVGFIMAKMVMGELMDPLIFAKFKSFLTKVRQVYLLFSFSPLFV